VISLNSPRARAGVNSHQSGHVQVSPELPSHASSWWPVDEALSGGRRVPIRSRVENKFMQPIECAANSAGTEESVKLLVVVTVIHCGFSTSDPFSEGGSCGKGHRVEKVLEH